MNFTINLSSFGKSHSLNKNPLQYNTHLSQLRLHDKNTFPIDSIKTLETFFTQNENFQKQNSENEISECKIQKP